LHLNSTHQIDNQSLPCHHLPKGNPNPNFFFSSPTITMPAAAANSPATTVPSSFTASSLTPEKRSHCNQHLRITQQQPKRTSMATPSSSSSTHHLQHTSRHPPWPPSTSEDASQIEAAAKSAAPIAMVFALHSRRKFNTTTQTQQQIRNTIPFAADRARKRVTCTYYSSSWTIEPDHPSRIILHHCKRTRTSTTMHSWTSLHPFEPPCTTTQQRSLTSLEKKTWSF